MLTTEDRAALRAIVREEAETRDGLEAVAQKLLNKIADLQEEKERFARELRQLVLDMRRYVLFHGLLLGECVAWERLKEMTGVGRDHDCPSETPAAH